MSRRLHLDPFAGAAGDMFLGLLFDLGWPAENLASLPRRLALAGVEVRAARERRGPLVGGRVRVIVGGHEEPPAVNARHGESGADVEVHGSTGSDRRLPDLLGIIERADLPATVKAVARRAFEELFRAEAKVHASTLEEVHLHEAGADDALVDICGTALGLHDLRIDAVTCSTPIPLGGGAIRCSHGLLPVPGPAVAALLSGVPVVGGPIDEELVTPTGAALLRAVVDEFRPIPPMTIERIGHGAGGRQDDRLPNVLRGLLGESSAGPVERTVSIVETNLDDMFPQDLPPLVEQLFDAGALDVWFTPVHMKKGRPGFVVSALAEPDREAAIAERLLRFSPTLGVRRRRESRLEWTRDTVTVATPWGPVRVKRALDGAGRPLRGRPEFEDCRRAADAGGTTVDEVRRAAQAAFDRDDQAGDKS